MELSDKRRLVWDAHCALRRMGYSDFDYVTLGWLLGYRTQGAAALIDKLTDEDILTCEQLLGPNGTFVFKVLEARARE